MIKVSVVTPTYNRRRFIPYLISCYEKQDYPLVNMEWIIMDDGQQEIKDLFDEASTTIPNIRYIKIEDKMTIGEKRNKLNEEAKGEIIVAMDDDDYYPPTRVSSAVNSLLKNPKINIAGSSKVFMYYTDIKEIYSLGPYAPNHATNGTMAWRKSYANSHKYEEYVTHSEERSFLNDYSEAMIQLDPMKVMLVMSHSENTFDKKKLLGQEGGQFVKKTSLKIKDFIKDNTLREFYSNA